MSMQGRHRKNQPQPVAKATHQTEMPIIARLRFRFSLLSTGARDSLRALLI